LRVLIVGASVSGLACAETILRLSSFDVSVVDKKLRVGENVRCAGGVSLHMLQKVGIIIPRRAITTRIRKIRIFAPNSHPIRHNGYWESKSGEDYGYILNREVFEEYMAKRVEALGGEFFLNYKVTTKKNFGQYDFIVGADGYRSVIADFLRVPMLPTCDVHLGVQRTLKEASYPQDTIEIFFGKKIAPKGYAWVFPNGDDQVKVGLGVPLPEAIKLQKLLDVFVKKRGFTNLKGTTIVPKLIPTGRFPNTGVHPVEGRHFLLVGDALPSTDPVTGGGIVQGIASGKAAGRAIAEGKPERYDYYIGWLKRQNTWRYRLKEVLYSFSDQDLNDLIQVMQGFKPKTMSVGKELRRAVVYLLLQKPRLLSKFFKLLR